MSNTLYSISNILFHYPSFTITYSSSITNGNTTMTRRKKARGQFISPSLLTGEPIVIGQSQSQSESQEETQPQHIYVTRYFNNFSNEHKSTLNLVFNGLSQDIKNVKIKSIIVGMKFEIFNSIVQSERAVNNQSTFTDSNGVSQTLTFKGFVIDQYIGQQNGQFTQFKDIKNVRQNARNYYTNRQNNGLFTNINPVLLQHYESAIQSNVK